MKIEHEENFDVVEILTTDPRFGFNTGVQQLRVHSYRMCEGRKCAIHNPSDHALSGCDQMWRADRHMMERICEHGIGHPDPDGFHVDGIHGCDGCCQGSQATG